MTLNQSFFINTALTITLLTSTALSANGKEVKNYDAGQEKYLDKSKVSQVENIDLHVDNLDKDKHSSILKVETKDHISENHSEVTAALSANSNEEHHSVESLYKGISSKYAVEKEFAFAILIFVVGIGYFYKSLNHM